MLGSCADIPMAGAGPNGAGPNGAGPHLDPAVVGARQVERARRRVEGELISWLVEVERSGSYLESGYSDVAAWGRGELRWCPSEARWRRGLVGLVRVAVLRRLEEHELAVDWAEARERHGDAATVDLLARTPAQRRYDAMQNLLAHVVLPTGRDRLDGLTGGARGQPWVEPFGPRRGRSETIDGVQVHPHDVVRASLVGMVRAVVVDEVGRPVQMSSVQRMFRGAMADAVRFTASRCTHPGCLVPATVAQIDHLQPSASGGATAVDNGGVACGHHNRWRSTARARTMLSDDGFWTTHTGDGRRIAPPD